MDSEDKAASQPDGRTSPLRAIIGVVNDPDHPTVAMDKLSCGHLLTHVGDANRQGRRRCHKCRLEAVANGDAAHEGLSPESAHARGCTCDFGCIACGYALAQMGDCPSFTGCSVGRAPDPDCPLSKARA